MQQANGAGRHPPSVRMPVHHHTQHLGAPPCRRHRQVRRPSGLGPRMQGFCASHCNLHFTHNQLRRTSKPQAAVASSPPPPDAPSPPAAAGGSMQASAVCGKPVVASRRPAAVAHSSRRRVAAPAAQRLNVQAVSSGRCARCDRPIGPPWEEGLGRRAAVAAPPACRRRALPLPSLLAAGAGHPCASG